MPADPSRAVFISYASQDAECARRIAEALRAEDVEVWFDQSELRGGDAWDAKIRRQIRHCALFLPVISARTQARREGYFRIEWKLGALRTHAIADGTPFLLPVVIDDTSDGEALVPAEFSEVQWTRLPGGVTSPAFAQRVHMLLQTPSPPMPTLPPFQLGNSRPPILARPRPGRAPVVVAAVAIAIAGLIWQPWRSPTNSPASAGTAVQTGKSPDGEVRRIRERLATDEWQKEDFAVVSAALDRIIQANPESADAWTLRSIINSLQIVRQYDRSTKPLEVGKSAADRALRLAPDSPLAEFAEGLHLMAMLSRGGDDEAYRAQLDRVLAKLPRDGLTRFTELLSYYHAYDLPGTERSARAWLKDEPRAVLPAWILASSYLVRRLPNEAEKWIEAAEGETTITGIRAHVTLFEVRYYLRADLGAARAALERVPVNGRAVHRVVHAHWLLAMAEKKWDEALQVLARLPEPLFYDRTYHGPRALLTGLTQRSAGRPEAAAAQFRESERLLRELLGSDPDNEALHAALALTLACVNRGAEARDALGQVEPLVSGRSPSIYRGPLVVTIAHAHREMNDLAATARWLRVLFAEPSDLPFTAASLAFDPRFRDIVGAPEIQALLREFAHLSPPNSTP